MEMDREENIDDLHIIPLLYVDFDPLAIAIRDGVDGSLNCIEIASAFASNRDRPHDWLRSCRE